MEKAETAEEMRTKKGKTKRWQEAEKANATARESEEVRGKGERAERRSALSVLAQLQQSSSKTPILTQRSRGGGGGEEWKRWKR